MNTKFFNSERNISTTNMNNTKVISKEKSLIDSIINSPESKMRMEIKEIEEFVSCETQKRRLNAPLTIEEKAFLSL